MKNIHRGHKDTQIMDNCIFCKIGRHEARSWMITESDHAYAILNIFPMNRWHTMVIPKKHYVNVFDLPVEELHEVMTVLKHVVGLFREKLGMENLQVVSSNGAAAQQEVFHSHWHIAPRFEGDGQDVSWDLYPEMVEDYDEMLEQLGEGKFVDAPIK